MNVVVRVYVQISNHSLRGCPSVLLIAPEGTDRETLDRAALAVVIGGPPAHRVTRASAHRMRRHSIEPKVFSYFPDAWATSGAGRLMGKPVPLDEALSWRMNAVRRLWEIDDRPAIYSREERFEALALAAWLLPPEERQAPEQEPRYTPEPTRRWTVQYGERRLGDTAGYAVTDGKVRIQIESESDAIAERDRRNAETPAA